MSNNTTMTIGQLAQVADVSTPTIRYYEEIGLLPEAVRSTSGQRRYVRADVDRLVFIRRCRDFGFSIDQVRALAGLSISPDRDCDEARDIAATHLEQVQAKLAEMRGLEKSLKGFVAQCDLTCSGGPARDCAVFKDMAIQPNASN